MARRTYGTGSLRVVGGCWYGSWHGPDGRRIKHNVGLARSPSERDGLTLPWAEKELRRIRDAEAEAEAGTISAPRVTRHEAGEQLSLSLKIKGHKKVAQADSRVRPAQSHRALLCEQGPRQDHRRRRRALIALKRRTLAMKTIPQPPRDHSQHIRDRPASRMVFTRTRSSSQTVPSPRATSIKFLDQNELEKLVAVEWPDDAFGRVEPTLYLVAAMTGLRQGELIGVRWRDVDFHARKIRVVSPYVRGEFIDPKSTDSSRSVPMAERVADCLTELRKRSLYPRDGDLVSPTRNRQAPGSLEARAPVQGRARPRSGPRDHLPRVASHVRYADGRQVCRATPAAVLDGHADIKTTQVYAHYQPDDDEADMIDEAFAT